MWNGVGNGADGVYNRTKYFQRVDGKGGKEKMEGDSSSKMGIVEQEREGWEELVGGTPLRDDGWKRRCMM